LKTVEEFIRGRKLKELVELYKLVREGKLVVEDPTPPKDYYEYLTRLDYSMWLWSGVSLATLTIASILLSSLTPVFTYLRYVLGTIFVLYMPGYFTIEALYPKEGELSNLERLALSIGLSLAITPLIGLILNYTPWGIRLAPVAASLAIYSLLMAFTASYRKYVTFLKAKRLRTEPLNARGRALKQ